MNVGTCSTQELLMSAATRAASAFLRSARTTLPGRWASVMSPTTALDQTTPSCSISAPATAYQYRYQATSSAAGPSSQTLPLVDESSVLLSSQDYVATPCPDCGQIIRVSSCTSYHMNKHRESQRCRKAAERRAMHRETAMATALRTQLFHNHGQRAGGVGTRSDKKYAEAGAQTTPTAVRRVSQWLREVRPVKVPRRSQSEPPPVVFVEEPGGHSFPAYTRVHPS